MLKIKLGKQVEKFLKKLPQKHARQIAYKIQELRNNPYPQDTKLLKGKLNKFWRTDSGEYRIIYHVENDILHIPIVGKRNDNSVYNLISRKTH